MPGHDAFLKEITENPEDLTPRLVYADWLDEQGDPRGEFIRVQCELARLDETDNRYPELLLRERELLAEHRLEWLKPLRPYIRSGTFRCGFVERAKFRFRAFLREGEKVAKLTPLRIAALTASGASTTLHELEDAPILNSLTGLEFHSFGFVQGFLEALINLSELPKLRRLKIANTPIPRRYVLRDLLNAPICLNLTGLSLRHMNLGADFFANLMARNLPLRQLDLSSSGSYSPTSGDYALAVGVRNLAAWQGLSRLTSLDVGGCRIQSPGLKPFIKSPHWQRIRHLNLGHYELFDAALVANQPAFSNLTALGLLARGLKTSQLDSLLKSPYLKKLRRLDITIGNDSTRALESLAKWPLLRQLTHLRLTGRDELNWEVLFRSSYWDSKTLLSVDRYEASRLKRLQSEHPEFRDLSITSRPIPMGYLHEPVDEF